MTVADHTPSENAPEQTTILPEGLPAPSSMPDGLDVPYWEALRRHELVVQRCSGCARYQWGPEHICHRCLSFELPWESVDPVGSIYSWQRIHHPTFPAVREALPYVVLLVEIDNADGIRHLGNLVGRDDPHIAIGQRVRGVFEDHHGPDGPYTLLQWERSES